MAGDFVARNTTLRMKWGALWVELGGRMCQVCRQNSPTVETSQSPWLLQQVCLKPPSFFECFPVAEEEKKQVQPLPLEIFVVMAAIKLVIRVGEGDARRSGKSCGPVCVCIQAPNVLPGLWRLSVKYYSFFISCFGAWFQKRKDGFAPTLERLTGARRPPGLVKHRCRVEEESRKLKPPGWELWFHQ